MNFDDVKELFALGCFEGVAYTDSTWTYVCRSTPGASLNSPMWQIYREKDDRRQWAGNTCNLVHKASDLATVQNIFEGMV